MKDKIRELEKEIAREVPIGRNEVDMEAIGRMSEMENKCDVGR